MVGIVLSVMVSVRGQLLWLPQASVAVKMTVAEPVRPQPAVKPLKSLVTTALPLHVSLAVALASQALIWAVLPAPSHSKTALVGQLMVGLVVSVIVSVRGQLLWLPQASVAVKMTVVEPVRPQDGESV